MKTIKIADDTKELPNTRPLLVINRGGDTVVMLFGDDDREGVVVWSTDNKDVGYRSTGWNLQHFSQFNGQIALENDK